MFTVVGLNRRRGDPCGRPFDPNTSVTACGRPIAPAFTRFNGQGLVAATGESAP